MPTAPAASDTPPNAHAQALYRAALQEAAAGGVMLMGKLVVAARLALQSQQAAARDVQLRDALAESASLLRQHEPHLCRSYPEALLKAFASPEGDKQTPPLPMGEVQFDQLELMDEVQVQNSVTLARVQQVAAQVAEASLADLNTLMCGVLGMRSVRADANPLRPQTYVNALAAVVAQTRLAPPIQAQWFNAMSATLGQELRALYVDLCTRWRKDGVLPVTCAMPAAAADPGAADARVAGKDQALLTLDKLRKLLSGELSPVPPGNRVEQFAAQFARRFDAAPADGGEADANSDFATTVPSALEALTEMKQVERVVQRMEQRRRTGAPANPREDTVEGQRLALRREASGLAQVLSLEVVTLMVDNMAHDQRLLEPVRQVIRNLEPALLRLALVDPRFFVDKQHPARRLLQELTHRSMAFDSAAASGFDGFVQHLHAVLAPLLRAPIESAEVFEQKLALLRQEWLGKAQASEKGRLVAVEVLEHAEARNLLAEKIASRIEAHPDSAKVPSVVIDFLCGPWAQVVAQARIKHGAGSAAAEKYEALTPALLWSTHLELARANPSKLTRVVPRLLTALREGLETIHYPGTRTSAFLEAVMAIHQQAFRGVAGSAAVEAAVVPAAAHVERMRRVEEGNPWVAPEEALASNFVEMQDAPETLSPPSAAIAPDLLELSVPQAAEEMDMPLGSWVELWVNGLWVRTQLTWASPHGTLYLFTGAFGTTQSMSRRSRDKLLANGKLRLISGQSVDQEALDAVAQTAMRNSVDSTL